MCEICSKCIPERRQWHRSHVFICIFEQISRIALVFSIFAFTLSVIWFDDPNN